MDSKFSLKKNNLNRSRSSSTLSESENHNFHDNSIQIKTKIASTSQNLSDEDDSLKDFKSPKLLSSTSSLKLIANKSVPRLKKKSRENKAKSSLNKNKPNVDKSQTETTDKAQATIESSFFKPKIKDSLNNDLIENTKTALICPICIKICKDEASHIIHTKSCAVKNNVSTKKLLDAIELQQKQALERESMGLLSAPIIQNVKNKPRVQRLVSGNDAELELAVALSKSLQEAQQLDELEDIDTLCGIRESLGFNTEEDRKTLQGFGFTSNKNIVESSANTSKPRRKKLCGFTILQTRSQEERERILTERIAEILIGNENVTQVLNENHSSNLCPKKRLIIKSCLLKEFHRNKNKLWDRAKLTPTQKNFYVSNLAEHIPPVDTTNFDQQGFEVIENPMNDSTENMNTKQCSKDFTDEPKTIEDSKLSLNTEEDSVINTVNKTFSNSVITDWRNTINTSSASDVIIFVKDNRHIWAHKLVFFVRCSNILLDITLNNNPKFYSIKEKICWADFTYETALVFLEFLYCGSIDKISHIFKDNKILSELRSLARKYKVRDLFTYLRINEDQYKNVLITTNHNELIDNKCIKKNDDKLRTSETIEKVINVGNNKIEENILDEAQNISYNTPKLKNEKDIFTMCLEPGNESPDIFDDSANNSFSSPKCNIKPHEHSKTHIKIDLSLDDEDENLKVESSNKNLKNDFTISNLSLEVSTPEKQMYNFSTLDTPKSSKEIASKFKKHKSELSYFIEKFKKSNENSDLDSPIEINLKPLRNPFNIKSHNQSNNLIDMENEPKIKRRKELSIFEESLRKNDKNEKSSENKEDNGEIININDFDSPFSQNLSTKFCETPKEISEDNSSISSTDKEEINEYIKLSNINTTSLSQIHSMKIDNFEENIHSSVSSSQETIRNQLEKNKNEEIFESYSDENCTQVEYSEYEMSAYSKYKTTHIDNSIADYRRIMKVPSQDISVSKSKNNEKNEEQNLEKNELNVEPVVTISSDSNMSTTSTVCFSRNENPVNRNVTDLNFQTNFSDSFEINEEFMQEFSDENIDNNSFRIIKSPNVPNDSHHNVSTLEIDPAINFHSDVEDSVINKSINRKTPNELKENSLVRTPNIGDEKSPSERNSFSNPMAVPSSTKLVLEGVEKSYELDDAEYDIFKQEIFLENAVLEYDDSPYKKTKFKKNSNETRYFSQIVSERDVDHSLSRNNTCIPKDNKSDVRKLTSKSKSDSTIYMNNVIHNKESNRKKESTYRKIKKIMGDTKYKCIKRNVTPPPNYDMMKTPELDAEMDKYGLRKQKRKRAVKLLTHIYNETHPIVSDISSSEEEVQSNKKARKDVESNNEVSSQDSHLGTISEESDHYIELMESISGVEGAISNLEMKNIYEEFFKLIKSDKELHNNILMYKPINLQHLHTLLKAKGLKCKIHSLMDFLDEQCITFTGPDNNSSKKKKQ